VTPEGVARGAVEAPSDSGGLIDLHNHLLPGVDDGASDEDEARVALASLRAEGVAALVVTPHFEAGLQLRPAELAARFDALDAAWARFGPLAAAAGLPVARGVELRLDLARPDLSDPRLRLAGGRFVLCEFPYFTVPPRSERVLAGVRGDGWYPIVAHPERYSGLDEDPEVIDRWLEAGALLQVNGGSLLGRYGETARRTAEELLESGCVRYVASDYHARGSPRIREWLEALVARVGPDDARLLTRTNPARLLRGELPEDGLSRRGSATSSRAP
jgi:protein-tyrosine phosphatase